MANYNREILVPYLRDVCSVEMLCQKLTRDMESCQFKINNCRTNLNREIVAVEKPQLWHYIIIPMLLVVLGIVSLLMGYFTITFAKRIRMGTLLQIVIFIFAACGIFYGAIMFGKDMASDYWSARHKYQKAIEENEKINREFSGYMTSLKQAEERSAVLKRQLGGAQTLRERVYGVNIIPRRYRNVYVAYYLFDYFSTSRETDLDKVIQTLLLDEIKQRLDKIVSQLETALLNQRYQTALQERQNEMIASNHREQMKRMARMEHNLEMQTDYLSMIEQNQNVTNFILTMDFLYK